MLVEDVLEEYPALTHNDVLACMNWASRLMANHYQIPALAQKGFLLDENLPTRLTFSPSLPVSHAREVAVEIPRIASYGISRERVSG